MEPEKAPGFWKRKNHLNQISSFWGSKAVDFPGVGVRFFHGNLCPDFYQTGVFFFSLGTTNFQTGGGEVPWISGTSVCMWKCYRYGAPPVHCWIFGLLVTTIIQFRLVCQWECQNPFWASRFDVVDFIRLVNIYDLNCFEDISWPCSTLVAILLPEKNWKKSSCSWLLC